MSRTGVYATVAFAREFLTPELPDQLAALVAAWTDTLRATPISLGIGVVTPFGVDYERPVPHRESRWQLGAIEYYLGRAWHLADAETAAVLRAVEAAPTPDGIVRTTAGDLTRVRFTCDVTDRATVAAARARGERWFAPLTETRLAPGWNAHGDRLAVIVDRDELAPFTFFDTRNGIGYKAMVVDPDTGDVDEPLWSALAAIADTKEAHDGTPIKGVRLIVPTRADAIRLTERAKAKSAEQETPDAVAARAMAVAEVEPPARRVEHDGIVTITWVEDPRDEDAIAAGAAAHEAWLLALLPSKPSPSWNEAGDERVHA